MGGAAPSRLGCPAGSDERAARGKLQDSSRLYGPGGKVLWVEVMQTRCAAAAAAAQGLQRGSKPSSSGLQDGTLHRNEPAEGLEMRVARFAQHKMPFVLLREMPEVGRRVNKCCLALGFSLSLSCDTPPEPDRGSSGPAGWRLPCCCWLQQALGPSSLSHT